MKKKILLSAIIALSLALLVAVGGTIAYLFVDTQDVVNTFTYGDINITLQESPSAWDDEDNNPNTNKYKMIPGSILSKDPDITVEGGSEECWLFVKVIASSNANDFLDYGVDQSEGAWIALTEVPGVYYRKVGASDVDQTFDILVNNRVTVKTSVTKVMLNALDPEGQTPNYPTLTFHAYAVQTANITDEDHDGTTADEAWNIAITGLQTPNT